MDNELRNALCDTRDCGTHSPVVDKDADFLKYAVQRLQFVRCLESGRGQQYSILPQEIWNHHHSADSRLGNSFNNAFVKLHILVHRRKKTGSDLWQ